MRRALMLNENDAFLEVHDNELEKLGFTDLEIEAFAYDGLELRVNIEVVDDDKSPTGKAIVITRTPSGRG
jgi:hypothetical protein